MHPDKIKEKFIFRFAITWGSDNERFRIVLTCEHFSILHQGVDMKISKSIREMLIALAYVSALTGTVSVSAQAETYYGTNLNSMAEGSYLTFQKSTLTVLDDGTEITYKAGDTIRPENGTVLFFPFGAELTLLGGNTLVVPAYGFVGIGDYMPPNTTPPFQAVLATGGGATLRNNAKVVYPDGSETIHKAGEYLLPAPGTQLFFPEGASLVLLGGTPLEVPPFGVVTFGNAED
jgi:hypothetical protein